VSNLSRLKKNYLILGMNHLKNVNMGSIFGNNFYVLPVEEGLNTIFNLEVTEETKLSTQERPCHENQEDGDNIYK